MVKKTKTKMGAFLSQLVGKMLGDPPSLEAEVDHNACICCGTMNVTEPKREDTEEKEDTDKGDGHQDAVHRQPHQDIGEPF